MNSYIKAIILFKEDGEKRIVTLNPGVNIITGESKTGKSALVEVIDYCLCSTRCTVPKGKITEFTHLYVMVMFINNHTVVIGRQRWNNGGKMYLVRESAEVDVNTIELRYFAERQLRQRSDIQAEIECELGLLVSNMVTDEENAKRKASLRNMVSYMFQHQNLMASKFALFYRFTDYYKRKDVIDQFPVFAGLIQQDYYSTLLELNDLKERLKKKEKQQKANAKSSNYVKVNLLPLLQDYYALIGLDLEDNLTVKQMLSLAHNLPTFDDSQLFSDSKIVERYNSLNKELENLRTQERNLQLRQSKLDNVSDIGDDYGAMLNNLKQFADSAPIEVSKYTCPLCGNECAEIADNDQALRIANEWLAEELLVTEKYTADFAEDSRKLHEATRKVENDIKRVLRQIQNLKQKYLLSDEIYSKREKANYAKVKIELYAEMNDSGLFDTVDEDIAKLKDDIAQYEAKLADFDLSTKLRKAETFLSNNMNRLAKTLDFEKEYRPINLNFGLTDRTFDLYHYHNDREKIYLYEMGSGANWVSCHVALFLSFLRLFATNEKSPMPLFLFLDQPSQVYFPSNDVKTRDLPHADIVAVGNMYKTIFDEVKSIEKDTKVLPQVLIVDHVDGTDLKIKDEFLKYARYNWVDGVALI